MYEKIIKDNDFLDTMEEIETIKFISDGKWDWEHGLGHVTRVTNYTRQILSYLGSDKKIIELGMTAAILHDIGLITKEKKGHAKQSAELAKQYLTKITLTEEDLHIITQAISDHSNGNNIQSEVGAALLMADKLDVSKYRVIDSSIKDELNNQIANIDEVDIKIIDDTIIINYLTNGNFDKHTLKQWSKAITCPLKAANYLNRQCVFQIDGKFLNIFDIIGEGDINEYK